MKRDQNWLMVPRLPVGETGEDRRQEKPSYIYAPVWFGKPVVLAWPRVLGKQIASQEPFEVEYDNWVAERSRQALLALGNCIEIHPQKLGGVPVIRGTRFSVAQLLGELGDNNSVSTIAENYEVDEQVLREFLHALAVYLNRPSG